MSSPRERAERAARAKELPEPTPAPRPQQHLTAGNPATLSTRQHAEAAASDAAGDPLVRPVPRHRECTQNVIGSTSVRDRATIAAHKAAETAKPSTSTLADWYLAEHKKAEAAQAAEEAALIKSGKLIRL